MARVRFTADFAWKPYPQVTQVFSKGEEATVRRECADAAINAKKAVEIEPAGRSQNGTAE